MDNNEAREILIERSRCYKEENMGHPLYIQAIDCAIQALGDGWISVDERLPDPVSEVLCFTLHGYGVEVLLFDGDKRFYTISSEAVRNPIFWQPLPSPPKPKQT